MPARLTPLGTGADAETNLRPLAPLGTDVPKLPQSSSGRSLGPASSTANESRSEYKEGSVADEAETSHSTESSAERDTRKGQTTVETGSDSQDSEKEEEEEDGDDDETDGSTQSDSDGEISSGSDPTEEQRESSLSGDEDDMPDRELEVSPSFNSEGISRSEPMRRPPANAGSVGDDPFEGQGSPESGNMRRPLSPMTQLIQATDNTFLVTNVDIKQTAAKLRTALRRDTMQYMRSLGQLRMRARPSILQRRLKEGKGTMREAIRPMLGDDGLCLPGFFIDEDSNLLPSPNVPQFKVEIVKAQGIPRKVVPHRPDPPQLRIARVSIYDPKSRAFHGNVHTVLAGKSSDTGNVWYFDQSLPFVARSLLNQPALQLYVEFNVSYELTPQEASRLPAAHRRAAEQVDELTVAWALVPFSSGVHLRKPRRLALPLMCGGLVSPQTLAKEAKEARRKRGFFKNITSRHLKPQIVVNLQPVQPAHANHMSLRSAPVYRPPPEFQIPTRPAKALGLGASRRGDGIVGWTLPPNSRFQTLLLHRPRCRWTHPPTHAPWVDSIGSPALPLLFPFTGSAFCRLSPPKQPHRPALSMLPDNFAGDVHTCMMVACYRAAFARSIGQDKVFVSAVTDPVIAAFPSLMDDPQLRAMMHRLWEQHIVAAAVHKVEHIKQIFRQVVTMLWPVLHAQAVPPLSIMNFNSHQAARMERLSEFAASHPAAALSHSAYHWLHKPFDASEVRFSFADDLGPSA